jgi:hypothetical protein
MPRNKALAMFILIAAVALYGFALPKDKKPKLKVAADGFPAGHDTPEGVASDLSRAFINHNVALFSDTCIGLYAGHKGPVEYDNFMRATIANLEQKATSKEQLPSEPKAIAKVFAARHLSRNGPVSYGYAIFDFQDLMFVDVLVELSNGMHKLNRTLVIKQKDGKWYAHPAPNVSPLLCDGLQEESASVVDFSEVYDIEK